MSTEPKVNAAAQAVSQNVVFTYPTISLLAKYVAGLAAHGSSADPAGNTLAIENIEKMIEKYSVGLSGSVRDYPTTPSDGAVVLLTGSTGGLGSYLLDSLLRSGNVRQVFAFNRPSRGSATIRERQRSSFEDRKLDTSSLDSKKLVFVEGDSAAEHIGLDSATYEEVMDLLLNAK